MSLSDASNPGLRPSQRPPIIHVRLHIESIYGRPGGGWSDGKPAARQGGSWPSVGDMRKNKQEWLRNFSTISKILRLPFLIPLKPVPWRDEPTWRGQGGLDPSVQSQVHVLGIWQPI